MQPLENPARDGQDQNEILVTLAHELRNALAPIANVAKWLQYQGGPESQLHQTGEVLERQVQQLAKLLDSLPDVSSSRDDVAELQELKAAPAQKARVLVVDDNVDAALTLVTLIKLWGHQVELVHDGPDALLAAARIRPDIVLLDIGLPGMNGYEVAQRLKHTPPTEKTVVVAMTGYAQEQDRRRSLEAGIDHHLVKPVDLDALKELISL